MIWKKKIVCIRFHILRKKIMFLFYFIRGCRRFANFSVTVKGNFFLGPNYIYNLWLHVDKTKLGKTFNPIKKLWLKGFPLQVLFYTLSCMKRIFVVSWGETIWRIGRKILSMWSINILSEWRMVQLITKNQISSHLTWKASEWILE